jgi:hypothetical protein
MGRGTFAILVAALAVTVPATFTPAASAEPHDALIAKHAAANGVPEHLVRRLIRIESRGNAAAVHRGNYGLMQIRHATARGVGYTGEAAGLLDPDTNLTYAVRYLAAAYRAAGCDADRAVKYYQRGYYGAAQRECGASLPAPAAPAVDVIKPKLVRTETIATSRSGPAVTPPVGSFEPARIAPAPAAALANAQPAKREGAPRTDASKPAAAGPAAKMELVSTPLAVDAELSAAAKPAEQAVQRREHLHKRGHGKSTARMQVDAEAKPELPAAAEAVVVRKRLVARDRKSRKRSAEARADPPSQMQPVQ